jgi:hypothetical protein
MTNNKDTNKGTQKRDGLNALIETVKAQQERITELERVVYDLAPEFEIIETMADSEEERRELLDSYLNLNNNYAEDRGGEKETGDKLQKIDLQKIVKKAKKAGKEAGRAELLKGLADALKDKQLAYTEIPLDKTGRGGIYGIIAEL